MNRDSKPPLRGSRPDFRAAREQARATVGNLDAMLGRAKDPKGEILRAIAELRLKRGLSGEQGLVLEAVEAYLKTL